MNYSHEYVHLKPEGTDVKPTPLGFARWGLKGSVCNVTVCGKLSTIGSRNVEIRPIQVGGNCLILFSFTSFVDYSWNELALRGRGLRAEG